MRKLRLLLLAVTMISVLGMGAHAKSNTETVVDEYSYDHMFFRAVNSSSDLIPYINNSFNHQGSYLSISTYTRASQTCDTLKVDIQIQKLVNGTWVNEGSVKTFSKSNASSLSDGFTYYGASSSYTYRAQFIHYAYVDGSTPSTKYNTISDSY